MTDTLEVRIAHLEGAYEQVDKRLGSIESAVTRLRSELTARMDSQVGRTDNQFHWLLGTILSTWVALLLAIFFRS